LLYLYLSSQTNNSLPKFSLLLPPSKKQVEYFSFLDKLSVKCAVNLDEKLPKYNMINIPQMQFKEKCYDCCENLFVIPFI